MRSDYDNEGDVTGSSKTVNRKSIFVPDLQADLFADNFGTKGFNEEFAIPKFLVKNDSGNDGGESEDKFFDPKCPQYSR